MDSVEAFVAADDKDVLASYGIVTALLASLAGHASPSDVSGWFVGSLWPEIESDDQRKERVKDVVLDAVWQLDQSLDAGLLPLLQPAPPQQLEEMQVDPLTPTQTRDKLAQTVKSLVVSLFAGVSLSIPTVQCIITDTLLKPQRTPEFYRKMTASNGSKRPSCCFRPLP